MGWVCNTHQRNFKLEIHLWVVLKTLKIHPRVWPMEHPRSQCRPVLLMPRRHRNDNNPNHRHKRATKPTQSFWRVGVDIWESPAKCHAGRTGHRWRFFLQSPATSLGSHASLTGSHIQQAELWNYSEWIIIYLLVTVHLRCSMLPPLINI